MTTTFGIDLDTGDLTADVEHNPHLLVWGGSVQYSMLYLKSAVIDLGLPEFINRLFPLVEFSFQTPVANTLTSGPVTTGTINPGVIWVGDYFQVGPGHPGLCNYVYRRNPSSVWPVCSQKKIQGLSVLPTRKL
jgi:hypothetical protein